MEASAQMVYYVCMRDISLYISLSNNYLEGDSVCNDQQVNQLKTNQLGC